MLPRAVSALIGVWLMAAPAVLGHGGAAATNDRIAGPLVAAFAIVAMAEVTRPLRWAEALIGAWLLVAPWITGAPAPAAASNVAAGVLLLVLATMGGAVQGRYGGGRRAASSSRSPCRSGRTVARR
ncbi:MAG TPA: SPW repeat protein [Thermodesulfobacteriota bacterium]